MIKDTLDKIKINFWFLIIVSAIMVLGALVSTALFVKSNSLINKRLAETTAANRPADLELTILADQKCKDCFDTNSIIAQIKKENVKINSTKTIDISSEEGKQIIGKFAIKRLPTFLITGELTRNSVLNKFFSQAGNVIDNTFVFRQVGGPYVDTAIGKIKGRLNLVLLTDITCTQCYDVAQHEAILRQFGMLPTSKVVDIKSAEGIALKNRYRIKTVPTFVLSGDVISYPNFTAVWPQVGMVAYDGAYVFTKGVPFMGTYKNLSNNQIITPSSTSAQ